MEDILLIGGGGHCKSVIDCIHSAGKYRIAAILDSKENKGKNICGYPISHTDDDLEDLHKIGINNAFITVGTTGKFQLRKHLYQKAKAFGFEFPVICDQSAIVSKNAIIEEGVFIGKNSVINTDAIINRMAIINTGAIIEHDCLIDEFAFISIGVKISGNVKIGYETFIGAGATIVQGISIAEHCLIGAGSVVVKNIEAHSKAFGVPCREMSKW